MVYEVQMTSEETKEQPPIVIEREEEEILHTRANGYWCDDQTCPCWNEPPVFAAWKSGTPEQLKWSEKHRQHAYDRWIRFFGKQHRALIREEINRYQEYFHWFGRARGTEQEVGDAVWKKLHAKKKGETC